MTDPVNVADYFERAAQTVDPQVWCYFEGGSGDEVSLRANAAARTPKRMVRWLPELRLFTSAQPSRAGRPFFSPRRQLGSPG